MLFMYFCSILIVLKIEALGESYFNAFKILFYHIYLIFIVIGGLVMAERQDVSFVK